MNKVQSTRPTRILGMPDTVWDEVLKSTTNVAHVHKSADNFARKAVGYSQSDPQKPSVYALLDDKSLILY